MSVVDAEAVTGRHLTSTADGDLLLDQGRELLSLLWILNAGLSALETEPGLSVACVGMHVVGTQTDEDQLEGNLIILCTGAQVVPNSDKVDQLCLSVGIRVLRFEFQNLHLVRRVTETEINLELGLKLVFDLFLALFDDFISCGQQRYVVEREI